MSAQDSTATPAWRAASRCRGMGLPAWRMSPSGEVIARPDDRGPVGTWLASGVVTGIVSGAVARWEKDDQPRAIEAASGCWLIPLVERTRRARSGYVVVMALTPGALDDEWFLRACDSARLDALSTRASLTPMARYELAAVRAIAGLLAASVDDLAELVEDRETITGFTRQLTDSYEAVDLLYSLGKSMSDLSHPRVFVERVCERLHESTHFGWMAVSFADDAGAKKLMGGLGCVRGEPGVGERALAEGVAWLMNRGALRDGPYIGTSLGPVEPRGAQVVAQPITRQGRAIGALVCGAKGGDDTEVSSYDTRLLESATGYIGTFLENASLYDDQRAMFLGFLQAMTAAIDAKDGYTRGHSERVAHLAQRLARAAGLDDTEAERLRICGLVHDVGKIGVPEAVLCKAGRLTEEEFTAIKQHPTIGHRILKDVPAMEDVLPGVLYHHERFDGKGYPSGLSGEAIPIQARIVALADTFDAMSSNRSYRALMPRERVLEEIRRCAGTQFDPRLAATFVGLDFAEYDELVRRHGAGAG